MKSVVRSLWCIGLLLSFTSFVSAADQTWTGKISDSMCGGSHAKMIAALRWRQQNDRPRLHAGLHQSWRQIRFVMGGSGKVYDIANQDLAALQTHAGHTVRLTGRDERRHYHRLKNRHARARENIGPNARLRP